MFSSRDAVDAGVRARPIISSTGPANPPVAIAAPSQGRSAATSDTGLLWLARLIRAPPRKQASKLRPLPRYSMPARATGATCPTSVFANGVLAPNSAAAIKAKKTP